MFEAEILSQAELGRGADLEAARLMVRESNHRIANSLQALIVGDESAGHPRCANATRELRARIAAIAALHRLLTDSLDDRTIDFGGYLERLVSSLRSLWVGRLGIREILLFHSGERIGGNAALRLGLIVNELVTNCCKYAYAGTAFGEVRVGFSIADGNFALLVGDDGLRTASSETTGGFGHKLVNRLARQFEAEFTLHAGHPGTIAMVSGPAALLLDAPEKCGRGLVC